MTELKPVILLLLLAIDDVSLPLRKNVCLHLSKPEVRAAPGERLAQHARERVGVVVDKEGAERAHRATPETVGSSARNERARRQPAQSPAP